MILNAYYIKKPLITDIFVYGVSWHENKTYYKNVRRVDIYNGILIRNASEVIDIFVEFTHDNMTDILLLGFHHKN